MSCVTPVRRVQGREVTTLEGLDPSLLSVWTEAFTRAGASQCGFCTPGIIMRLAALVTKKPEATRRRILERSGGAPVQMHGMEDDPRRRGRCSGDAPRIRLVPPGAEVTREHDRVTWRRLRSRAEIEGRSTQLVGQEVAAGFGGFADDSAPDGALVAVPDREGGWSVAGTLTEARRLSGKVQGRNSGARPSWPLEVPDGDWAFCLQTTFVEPAYLEPDASWCEPGGEPASPVANGGAFGGKVHPVVTDVASTLAAEHGTPVRVLLSREDVVRLGPKRPPIAAGMRLDGSGVVRVARTPGSLRPLRLGRSRSVSSLPGCSVEVVDVAGPPVSSDPRGAGWVEAAVLSAGVRALSESGGDPIASAYTAEVSTPEGGLASVTVEDGNVRVVVDAGEVLDEVVLRSYCVGAVHQALGWVRREAVAVDASGEVLDLTIRSFGILSAREMPRVEVQVVASGGPPVNVSDAVFAATAASAWIGSGLSPRWPASEAGPR